MPRDNMATLIQRIARQARLTFRRGNGGSGGAPEAGFPDNLQQLQQLLSQLRAEDLNIRPRRCATLPGPSPPPPPPSHLPPVTYMHICETAEFSLGVFLLKSGTSIPLHDHPGMYGVLKVLYGTLRISCLDPLPPPPPPAAPPPRFDPPLRSDSSHPCALSELAASSERRAPKPPPPLRPPRAPLLPALTPIRHRQCELPGPTTVDRQPTKGTLKPSTD
ncbi:2-aminoethanethiol dioxygenase [Gracilinanus agilis]|uniref:2-aminoethanethiol dioxygenase n=1 Tax=Gracilinanus agilis TaxID=191870 RepID=UPI001CFCFA59|nr:2-aminoethanethiol dioxygenase [Gracilinanus agilis]